MSWWPADWPVDVHLSRFHDGDRDGVLALVRPVHGPLAAVPFDAFQDVFADEESGDLAASRSPVSWAGKLAAKLAVADLLGVAAMRAVRILPDGCRRAPLPCPGGHPPTVRLAGWLAAATGNPPPLALSITHESTAAAAVVTGTCARWRPPSRSAGRGR